MRDSVSFPPLESRLVAVLDPPMTTSSLLAPLSPSTFGNNATLIMTFPDPPFSLTQSMEYEEGEPLSITASAGEDGTCYESSNAFIEVHNFHATLVGRSYKDVVVTVLASLDMGDNISTDPLDALHASPLSSLPSPSNVFCNMLFLACQDMLVGYVFDCVDSLGTFRVCDPICDRYSLYLRNMPAKILLTFAFNHSTDFSKAAINFEEHLLLFHDSYLSVFTYIHLSCMPRCLISSCKLLTASKWVPRILRCRRVGDALHASHGTILRR